MSKTTLFDSRIKKYAYREAAQLYGELGSSPAGLSPEQVERQREKYGSNCFGSRSSDTMLRRLRRAFINPFNVILFVLGSISLVTDSLLASDFSKNATTALIIFSMILISGGIRLVQELRAKNAAQQLDRLIHQRIRVRRGGVCMDIPAEELVVGDVVLLSAGDRVPADLRLTAVTDLFLSQAAITGESAVVEKSCRTLCYGSPRPVTQLENLAFMATTVISGKGEGIVVAVGKNTLYGSFAKDDPEEKQAFQKGANSIAWVMLRFMGVLIPLVFLLLGLTGGNWLESFAFALSVAVGLMPEMLPMVITACLARGSLSMSRKQTIIKDINAMQGFGSMDVLCMDKTGTLTQGTFKVVGIHPENGVTGDALVEAAALAESWSKHPISLSIKNAYGKDIDPSRVTDVQELGGHGVTAKVDGKTVAAGNARLMAKLGLTVPEITEPGTIVHVAMEGRYAGYLLIADVVKPHSAAAIRGLKQAGVRKTVMLTGDAEPVAKAVSAELGLDEYHAGLLPGDKVDQIETLLAAKQPKENLAFVGDGINDAPVLSRADVGIAMGALGSDAAIEAADVVLMDDDPAKIALAMRIARRTLRIVYQNIVFALAIKFACLVLGALGLASMWTAIFADVGVMVLAVLNATRALYTKDLAKKNAQ